MRGAHRGVWCSKGQRLMEAKLFAAESKRPAQNGRALAARRFTQSKFRAVKRPKLCPTHGTEPPYPRFAAHLRCVSAKEGLGSQEGTGNHWCPVPFCPCRWAPASPPPDGGIPAGEHRLPRPPKAATVHTHFERKPLLQRRTAVSAEGIPSADGKKNFYLSFGRRMFRMIATNAAGTIPEPPKISWIACGACARMDIFAPMP